MQIKSRLLRTILGVFSGEITLILLTTFAQEILYDGISYNESPPLDLVIGGMATFMAAIFAGLVASYIGGKLNFWTHIIISILITVEMTYLISSGKTADPIWFDVIGGSVLIAGIWIGHIIRKN